MLLGAPPQFAAAEDMTRFLDLKSDEFTKADMTRSRSRQRLPRLLPLTSSISPAGGSIVSISRAWISEKLSCRQRGSMVPGSSAPTLTAWFWIKHGR